MSDQSDIRWKEWDFATEADSMLLCEGECRPSILSDNGMATSSEMLAQIIFKLLGQLVRLVVCFHSSSIIPCFLLLLIDLIFQFRFRIRIEKLILHPLYSFILLDLLRLARFSSTFWAQLAFF